MAPSCSRRTSCRVEQREQREQRMVVGRQGQEARRMDASERRTMEAVQPSRLEADVHGRQGERGLA